MKIDDIQAALRETGIGGWLFIDFRRRDFFAYEILGLPTGTPSRRWAYYIPATGEPQKLLHRIEPKNLAGLPGEALWYSTWRELEVRLAKLLAGEVKFAMQYSPCNALPYLSTVDAGTMELVRKAAGRAEIVSSARLISRFQGLLTEAQIASHAAAGERVHQAKDECFAMIRERAVSGNLVTEREAADFIERRFKEMGVVPEGHGPNVSCNSNAANPHYDPPGQGSAKIGLNSAVLIDLWGKMKADPQAVVYDITWCAWVGPGAIPRAYEQMFETVVQAREAAVELITQRCEAGKEVTGAEADDAARGVLAASAFAAGIWHRTGHAIDTRTHGSGTNLDNYETQDSRPLLPGACFSIEPGLYLSPWGVRTEINMVIDGKGVARRYGPEQKELLLL